MLKKKVNEELFKTQNSQCDGTPKSKLEQFEPQIYEDSNVVM